MLVMKTVRAVNGTNTRKIRKPIQEMYDLIVKILVAHL